MRYRKRPIEVDAAQWDGTDDGFEALYDFTEGKFCWWEETVYSGAVYDKLHDTWVKLRTGDWVIKGISGEVYPCDVEVFERTYELVG